MVEVRAGVPALILAPMEGVTDAPMRALLTAHGGLSFCVSEFLRISQEVPPARVFLEHVPELATRSRTVAGVSVQVQLLGGDSQRVARSARVAVEAGALAIDLNFGCPAPIVNKHDGGAALLKFPERIRQIVEETRKALPPSVPLSAKLRLGWDSPDAIHRNAESAAEGGVSWITIHGRTRMQGYTPPSYWGPIGEVQKRLGIPVVANGEIWTLDDFKRCRDETRCEHFMIGRGALADPMLQWRIARELGVSAPEPVAEMSRAEWRELLAKFSELASEYSYRPGYVPCRIKQWAKMAQKRFPSDWYERIKTLKSVSEILAVMYS